jgi:hypothetical protein
MKRRYRGGQQLRVALWVGERVFDIHVQPDYVSVQECEPEQPDVTIRGNMESVLQLLFLHYDTRELLESGAIQVQGSRRVFRSFLAAFPASPAPATFSSHADLR